jgi:hypothetical protein
LAGEEIKSVIEDIKYAKRVLAGGPDERGLKLLKMSGFFLVVPDPTMISTTIGVSMLAAGKILSRRSEKGLKDHIDEFLKESLYLRKEIENLF